MGITKFKHLLSYCHDRLFRPKPSLSSASVIWAYRLFLDREPDSPSVVAEKAKRLMSTAELRKEFINSEEFKQKHPGFHSPTLSGFEPPISVEQVDSDAELQALFQHIQKVWQHLGETEPYWSVLVQDKYKAAAVEPAKARA